MEPDHEGALWIPARYMRPAVKRDVQLVVLHSTETPRRAGAAVSLGKGWQLPQEEPRYRVSSHYIVDDRDIVQCVLERDVAFTAGAMANWIGVHIEMIGYTFKTNWAEEGIETLRNAAKVTRGICERHQLPLEGLDVAAVISGRFGVCTHATCTKAWHQSDHGDPGGWDDKLFAWETFMALLLGEM